MKKFTYSLFLVFLSFAAMSQKSWVSFTSDQPKDAAVTILHSDRSGLVLEVTVPGMFTENVNHEGQSFQRITLVENHTTQEEGRPELPMLHKLIGIPGNQKIAITLLEQEFTRLNGYNIFPFQTPTTDNPGGHDHPFVMDKPFYQKNAFYPAETAILGKPGIWRDVKVAGVHITPFTYNPVTQELKVTTKLTLKIEFSGMDASLSFNPRKELTPKFYQMYKAAIANFDDLGYTMTYRDNQATKYLVITNPEAIDAIQPLVNWKNEMGHKVEVRVIESGFDTPQLFKTYISELYEAGLEYVLMVGDAYPNGGNSGGPNVVPMYYWAPGGEDPSYSDSWYTCLDGPDDHYADIAIGRFVYDVNQLDQLELQIEKTMTHYLNANVSDNWAENSILIAHKQEYPGKYTQCCEEIRTYNYSIQTPIFEKAYGGEDYSNAQVVDFVNNTGVGIFNYRGHGGATELWEWTTVNPISFTATDVNQLTNYEELFVFFDVCCDNMDIVAHSGNCLCESFMKHTGGSVAVNGAIIPSYTIPNHDYDKEMYKAVFDEGITNIGYVTNFANVTVLNVHGTLGRSNVRTYLWLGDASLEPWTMQPTEITALHNEQLFLGLSEFVVNVMGNGNPLENALVCVTNEDGSVYGVAYSDAAGVATVQFDEPVQIPGEAKVTVTKFNHIPYQAVVPVIPQEGPYVVKDSWEINDNSGGNGNGLMDYAESVLLTLSVKNVGIQVAQNVIVTLSTESEYIDITTATANFGNIDPDAVVTVEDAFAFDVAEDIPDNHAVLFTVSATNGTDTWNSNIVITGHAPVLIYDSFTILDPTGNNNGKLDPGEEATIEITLKNEGSAGAVNVNGLLSTNDTYLEITQTGPVNLGDMEPGASAVASFEIYAADDTPAGHSAILDISVNADHNITGTGSFTVIIGQIPVIIIDLDPNHNSGTEMQGVMNTIEVTSEYATSIPANLSLYSSAFVCLGIYSNNHVLTTAEGQQLADFLNAGGSLYMEGGDTWYYDPQTSVHSMFKIDPVEDGSSNLSTIAGQEGTFTEGLSFAYNGDNSYIDHIEAILPAVKIFQNQSPSYGTAVAYDGGTYKTIGASHEFGGLSDGNSTKEELMEEYLIFFNIISSGITASFQADQTLICENDQVEFTDNSTGQITEWAWEFPGGNPETSSLQNPVVIYSTPGQFDVSLTVTGPDGSNTITKADYIEVTGMPGAAAIPVGITQLCENAGNTDYTTTGATNATEYVWSLTPMEAGIITGNGLTATVDWTDDFYGEAQIMVYGMNFCGEGNPSELLMVTIDPLPEDAGTITGNNQVCQGFSDFYTIETIGFASSYNWTLTPEEAGTLQVDDNEVTITWSNTFTGNVVLNVCGVNSCGNGLVSADFEILVENCIGINNPAENMTISVFPNPNTGHFILNLNGKDTVKISLMNTLGEIVFVLENISLSGKQSQNIEVNLSDGVYLLKVQGNQTYFTEKVIIRK
ncbi:MAG: T9SS type A sorting domain-containing protein [Sphingobacteriia bacterium]|nr:T9SS type A sorting domain-containing protein [Sphingobacteriia bacterium]